MNLEHANDDELHDIQRIFGRLRAKAADDDDWPAWIDCDDIRTEARAELDKRRKEARQ